MRAGGCRRIERRRHDCRLPRDQRDPPHEHHDRHDHRFHHGEEL